VLLLASEPVTDELDRARRAFAAGELDHAASHLANVLFEAPARPEAHELLARLAAHPGGGRELFPIQGRVALGAIAARAHIAAAEGDVNYALATLARAQKAAPRRPWTDVPWVTEPATAAAANPLLVAEIIDNFIRLISDPCPDNLRPAMTPYLYLLRNTIAAHPDCAEALTAAGFFVRRFDPAEALGYAERAEDLAPSRTTAISLGSIYRKLGRIDDSLAAWNRALTYNERNLDIYADILDLLTPVDRLDEAKTYAEQALAIDPDHICAKLSMLAIQFLQTGGKRYLDALEQLHKTQPEGSHGRRHAGQVLGLVMSRRGRETVPLDQVMTGDGPVAKPPRPLATGDIVATYSEQLGEWTAGQVVGFGHIPEKVRIIDLDWSGAEPVTVADLGGAVPLTGVSPMPGAPVQQTPVQSLYDWLLPRGYKVIGSLPLRASGSALQVGDGTWRVGALLAARRWRDNGGTGPWSDLRVLSRTAAQLEGMPMGPHLDVFSLEVTEIGSLDCARLADDFPDLTELSLSGYFGQLVNAAALNRLAKLKQFSVWHLIGMSPADTVLPSQARAMERIVLRDIPADYAAAMRTVWGPELRNGTSIDVTGARDPSWLARYDVVRRAMHDAMPDPARMGAVSAELARDSGGMSRAELREALELIVTFAEDQTGADMSAARASVTAGLGEPSPAAAPDRGTPPARGRFRLRRRKS
jgi:tetratricopeptide (TPR) repeat protein